MSAANPRATACPAAGRGRAFGGDLDVTAYAIDSSLQLYSDFTYFLDDPVNGDEFEQVDDRRIYGFNVSQQWDVGRSRWRVGAEGRFDDIGRVALLRTNARQLVGTVRDDAVEESSAGVLRRQRIPLQRPVAQLRRRAPRRVPLRCRQLAARELGPRVRRHHLVQGQPGIPADQGPRALCELRHRLPLQRCARHDDHRGPGHRRSGAKGRSAGGIEGRGTRRAHPFQRPAAGHAGGVDAEARLRVAVRRRCRRRPSPAAAASATASSSACTGSPASASARTSKRPTPTPTSTTTTPTGEEIPGAIPLVLGAGGTFHGDNGWLASAQVKHFGKYPLIEDDSVESAGSTILNLRVGREWSQLGPVPRRAQCAGQRRPRHRLLLRLAPAGRAGGGRRGHPLPRVPVALVARHGALHVLSNASGVVAARVPRPQAGAARRSIAGRQTGRAWTMHVARQALPETRQ